MSLRYYANNSPSTTLAAGITSLDTSIQVASLTGFPASFPYTATLELGDPVNAEVVLVTAAAGTTLTVQRGYNSTTAVAHSAGKSFDATVIAQDFREANDHVNATSAVHGLAGGLAGLNDVQTLSNKTLPSPTLTGTANAAAINTSGNVSVGGNETVAGTLGVTGATTLHAATASGLVTANAGLTVVGGETLNGGLAVDTVTASGLVRANGSLDASGGKYVKFPSFTNEAAATAALGTPTAGQTVYLSSPTTAGMRAGLYVWTGSSWVPPGPLGLVAMQTGPGSQTDYGTTAGNVVTINPTLVSGRKYRVSTQILGSLVTVSGIVSARLLIAGAEPPGRLVTGNTYQPGAVITGTATWVYTASANGAVEFDIQAFTSAGAYRIPANQAQIVLEDIGT